MVRVKIPQCASKIIAENKCYDLHGLISRLPDKRLGRRHLKQEKEGEEDEGQRRDRNDTWGRSGVTISEVIQSMWFNLTISSESICNIL